MIRFVSTAPKKKSYGRFFLHGIVTEAPGDPDDPTTANVDSDDYQPAANTRVINVLPGERTRRLNFDYTPPTELNAPDPTAIPTDNPVDPTQPGQTPEPTISDASPDSGGGMPDPDGPVPDDQPITDTPPDTGADAPAPEDVGGATGPDVDPAGSNLNFDDPAANAQADANAPVSADPNAEQRGPGIEYDSTRKYNLFKDFTKLALALDNYISRLENILSDNAEQNKIIMLTQKNMRELKELTKDYMLIRFDSSTYAQSLLFYELMKTTLQVIFDNLEKAKKKILKMEDPKRKGKRRF